jgi:hypothetical protein
MMLRLILALQSVGATGIPPDFDLGKVKPSDDPNAIVVTARKQSQRIERTPIDTGPPLGRAETDLIGNARIDAHVESGTMAGGASSQRAMVRVKIPF